MNRSVQAVQAELWSRHPGSEPWLCQGPCRVWDVREEDDLTGHSHWPRVARVPGPP